MKRTTRKKIKTNRKAIKDNGWRLVPLVKYFTAAVFLILAVVMLPLSMVWKQVYITDISKQHHALRDSLAVLQKEVTTLTFTAEDLAGTRRIESIARGNLGLDYPSSKEIVVLRPQKKKEKTSLLNSPFWTAFRKSITPEKG